MDITNAIVADFRGTPSMVAFSDTTKWPDSFIVEALCQADAETGSSRWGPFDTDCHNLKKRGMYLYAAAWLVNNFLDSGPLVSASGEARLNVAAKSIGDESITYRTPSMLSAIDDWLSFSHYGTQFMRLRKRVGMGAVAV